MIVSFDFTGIEFKVKSFKIFIPLNCTLTIVRYPKYCGFAGLLSMALFRLPLSFNKKINFWKLLGCGSKGTFDIHPDWRQWAVLMVNGQWSMVNEENQNNYKPQTINYKLLYGSYIYRWWKFF